MAIRSIFVFTCLHLGFGPTVSWETGEPLPTAIIPPENSSNVLVQWDTVCPLCCSSGIEPTPGQGILIAWNFTTGSWSWLGSFSFGELTVRKWVLGMDEETGQFRPTMWLPHPCGSDARQLGLLVSSSARYRQQRDGPFETRVPGMLSYLNRALFLTPQFTPGIYNVYDHSRLAGLEFFRM